MKKTTRWSAGSRTVGWRAVWVLLLLIAWPSVSCGGSGPTAEPVHPRPDSWARPLPDREGLPNLHQVSEGLYRGAQPEDEGFAELKSMGIKTVVNIRTFGSDRSECKESGLDYVKISMQAWNPNDKDVAEFLRVATDPERQPVFVHCLHGADRTGMVVAVYRALVEGWSKEEALAEMTGGGFGFHTEFGNLLEYVEELDLEKMRSKAGFSSAPADTVALPRPDLTGSLPLEQALERRRSVRDYSAGGLTLQQVGQLLWAGQGISGDGRRTAPSAGALYPLELYLVAGKVEGLDPGVYKYRPGDHRLARVAAGDRRALLSEAALGQSSPGNAAAVIVVAAIYARTTKKYGDRGIRYVHMEVGFAAENVLLQASEMKLGSVFIGAFHDDQVHEVLDLPANEKPLGLVPVGYPLPAREKR